MAVLWMRRGTHVTTRIQIRQDLTAEQMCKVLVIDAVTYGTELADLTGGGIVNKVREHLQAEGTSKLDWFGDQWDEADRRNISPLWLAARARMLKHWPMLAREIPLVMP
jgi:hypothetical protein